MCASAAARSTAAASWSRRSPTVLERVRARRLVVSFSDEGFLTLPRLRELWRRRGEVHEVSVAHPRYIGHRPGVYNPQGEKVGTPGAAKNREHLFVVECADSLAGTLTVRPRHSKAGESRQTLVKGMGAILERRSPIVA
jgi:hypothetical protein